MADIYRVAIKHNGRGQGYVEAPPGRRVTDDKELEALLPDYATRDIELAEITCDYYQKQSDAGRKIRQDKGVTPGPKVVYEVEVVKPKENDNGTQWLGWGRP